LLGVVTGLSAEAKIVADLHCHAICGGGRVEATQRKIDRLVAEGATGLISFGIAGALDPKLKAGDLVISATVIDGAAHCYVGSPNWLEQALKMLPHAHAGDIYASDTIISSVDDKARIFKQYSTLSVDMESHHMARVAAKRGLPFIVLRAIADNAGEALPSAFGAGVDEDGQSRPWPIIASLLSGRLRLAEVLRVAKSTSRALATLRSCRPVVVALAG
jgi:adenosylhomocysteine nucleosidase